MLQFSTKYESILASSSHSLLEQNRPHIQRHLDFDRIPRYPRLPLARLGLLYRIVPSLLLTLMVSLLSFSGWLECLHALEQFPNVTLNNVRSVCITNVGMSKKKLHSGIYLNTTVYQLLILLAVNHQRPNCPSTWFVWCSALRPSNAFFRPSGPASTCTTFEEFAAKSACAMEIWPLSRSKTK